MKENHIFIHSLFRTGSTYIWNKFRQNDRCFCYYEPFHQNLVFLNVENPDLWEFGKNVTDQMRHPRLEKSYTYEYRDLLAPVQMQFPLFKKSFSFDEYCNNSDNPDAKKYIDSLIENAKNKYKIPVLHFNRSSLRIRWFKENYPNSVHLYLARDPRDQFQSYMEMLDKNNLEIFLIMDLLIAGKNRGSGLFKILDSHVPLVDYHNDRFENEELIYSKLVKNYTVEDRYYIFYFIWLYSLFENVLNADLILNIDLLSHDSDYRRNIGEWFDKMKISKIDFKDANISRYKNYCLKKGIMEETEQEVQSLFFDQIKKDEDKDLFFSKLSGKNGKFFNIGIKKPGSFYANYVKKNKDDSRSNEILNKYKSFFKTLADDLVAQNNFIRQVQDEGKQKNDRILLQTDELNRKTEQLSRIIRKLDQKDQELSQSDKQLVQKDRQLSRKDIQLAQKDKQLEQKDRQVTQKDIQLETKIQELARRGELLEEQAQKLIEKNLLIKEKNNQIKEKNQELENKDMQLAQKDKQLGEIAKELARQTGLVKESLQQLAQKDKQLEQKDRQVTQKDEQLGEMAKELARQTELLEESLQMLAQKDRQLTEEIQLLREEDQLLAEKERQISQMNQQLHQKVQQMAVQALHLEQIHQTLKQLKENLTQKDKRIQSLLNSKSYQIGRGITFPLRFIEKKFKKQIENEK